MRQPSPIPVIGIRAFSKTGKTTLIKKLIPCFSQQKIGVGVLKHTHHNIEIDQPGKDSFEISHAGSVQTLIASDKEWALTTRPSSTPTTDELLSQFNPQLCQIILIEGYKESHYPSLLLSRTNSKNDNLQLIDETTIAIATDQRIPTSLPQLDINNPHEIMHFLIEKLLRHRL